MDYTKFIVSTQKEERMSIQRVLKLALCKMSTYVDRLDNKP